MGRASHGRDELIDNVMAAIEGVVLNVPKKWKNVRSLHLKATNSLALPLYGSMESCAKIEGSSGLSNVKEEKQGDQGRSQVEEMVEVGDEVESESDVDAQDRFNELVNYLTGKHKNSLEHTENTDAKEIKRRKVKHASFD